MIIEYEWKEIDKAKIANSLLSGSNIASALKSNVRVPGTLTVVHHVVVDEDRAERAEGILMRLGYMGRKK